MDINFNVLDNRGYSVVYTYTHEDLSAARSCSMLGACAVIVNPILMPQIDQLKSYKPFFVLLGNKIGSDKVIGYKLSETIEAYSLFYGGFAVDNTVEREVFAEKLKHGTARYIIALPKMLKPEHHDLLQKRGEKLMEDEGKWRKKIELWKLTAVTN